MSESKTPGIASVAVQADGSALVALWPPQGCAGCQRMAAFGTIVLVNWRNHFYCLDCRAQLATSSGVPERR